jgi:hypothetical protein
MSGVIFPTSRATGNRGLLVGWAVWAQLDVTSLSHPYHAFDVVTLNRFRGHTGPSSALVPE